MALAKERASGPWVWLWYLIFFMSGFSALAYEIIWIRKFGLVFGVTAYATSAVLSSFFVGLALGSWLAGRRLLRLKINPLLVYVCLEAGIGLYALAVPFLLDSLYGIYGFLTPLLDFSFITLSLMRLFFSILVLMIPTTFMGATLPLVSDALSPRIQNVTVNVSGLYAINTFGALTGAAFSGFYSIGKFGMTETTWIAVASNLLAASLAFLAMRRFARQTIADAPSGEPQSRDLKRAHPKFKILLLGLFLSGFAALGYEVVWTRVISMFMDRTVFAYTTILSGVLLGIAVGSWLLRVFGNRVQKPLLWLAALELGVAWMTIVSMTLISQAFPSSTNNGIPITVGIILVIPNAMLGMTLPLAVKIYQEEFERVGTSVGDLYSSNVLGGVLGSFVVGFIFLSALGSQNTLLTLTTLNVLIAAIFLRYAESQHRALSAIGAGVSAIAILLLASQPQFLFTGIQRGVFGNQQVIFNNESVESTVTITENGLYRTIYTNGLHQSNTRPETLTTHRRLAHLPLVLHPQPNEMLIVGLGSGSTAGAATRHPIRNLRIVELVPGMYSSAAFFADTNYEVLRDPRVKARLDDGRNFLLLTNERYDVIEADVIEPWLAGANNLYSIEYYKLIQSRLKPGGEVAQWLHTGIPEEDYKILLRTFVTIFPNTTLWSGGSYAIAMPDGIRIDEKHIRAVFADSDMAGFLQAGGYASAEEFLDSFTMGPDVIRKYVGAGPILSDNNPYLEYNRVLDAGAHYQIPSESIRPFLVRK